MVYFKITNIGDLPIMLDWNRSLLDTTDQEAYDFYKTTPEYLGIDNVQKASFSKVGEAIRMRPFFDALGRGIQIKANIPDGYGITRPESRYNWAIGCDYDKMKQRGLKEVQELCSRLYIIFSPKDTKDLLIQKIKDKVGPATKVITEEAMENLISTNQIAKKIRQKLQPGQTVHLISSEGNIEAEEVEDPNEDETPVKGSAQEKTARQTLEELDGNDLRNMAKERKLPYVGQTRENIIRSLLTK